VKKIFITGAEGQLGRAFQHELGRLGVSFIAANSTTGDITKQKDVERLLETHQPGILINCAAFNLVDEAEIKRDRAFDVNAAAVGVLANACKLRGIKLVHYSTDYVFNGQKKALYKEDDPTQPLNVYGASKLEGENLVRTLMGDHLIFRTSWVYGEGVQNFLYKVTQWAKTNPQIRVASDEISVPTSTIDLVAGTLKALDQGLSGLYHLTNSGYASRYEWAEFYLKAVGSQTSVMPVPLSYFQPKVARPLFSAMSNARIAGELGWIIPRWQEAVERYVQMNNKQG